MPVNCHYAGLYRLLNTEAKVNMNYNFFKAAILLLCNVQLNLSYKFCTFSKLCYDQKSVSDRVLSTVMSLFVIVGN
jgi:hypothetical protein